MASKIVTFHCVSYYIVHHLLTYFLIQPEDPYHPWRNLTLGDPQPCVQGVAWIRCTRREVECPECLGPHQHPSSPGSSGDTSTSAPGCSRHSIASAGPSRAPPAGAAFLPAPGFGATFALGFTVALRFEAAPACFSPARPTALLPLRRPAPAAGLALRPLRAGAASTGLGD